MTGTVRYSRAGSAVVVGVVGWLAAHLLSLWLILYGDAGVALPAGHVHGLRAGAAAAAGMLAAGAVVATLVAGRNAARRARDSSGRDRGRVLRSVALSTLAFLTADAVEHAVLDLQRTPPALLMFGAVLHVLFSVGGSLCWLRLSDAALTLRAWLRPQSRATIRLSIRAQQRPAGLRSLLWAAAVSGRAPPHR